MLEKSLSQAIREYKTDQYTGFHTPGHGGAWISEGAKTLLGEDIWKVDLTEIPGLDDLHNPDGCIKKSQQLAADIFGADHSYYLINGSSAGIIAMIMTVTKPGEKIMIPQNAHQSVYHGLILSGAIPEYLPVESLQDRYFPLNVRNESINNQLQQRQISTLLLTNPSYYGVCMDFKPIREEFNIPILVDEAHGAHLSVSGKLPDSSKDMGADLWVQSTHKTLGSLTQSSMLHLSGERIDTDRLELMLRLVQSTSPSYPLMASLDLAREQIDSSKELWETFLEKLFWFREELGKIPELSLLTEQDVMPKGFGLDPTKVTVFVDDLGLTGYQVANFLHCQYQINVELAGYDHILLLTNPAHTTYDFTRILTALKNIRYQAREVSLAKLSLPPLPIVDRSPRDAVNSEAKEVLLKDALGEVSKQFITPYPPGIPIIAPGEVITREIIDYVDQAATIDKSYYQGGEQYSKEGKIKVIKNKEHKG